MLTDTTFDHVLVNVEININWDLTNALERFVIVSSCSLLMYTLNNAGLF